MLRKYTALLIVFPLFLASAGETAQAQTGPALDVGILIFGDTGYLPQYPEAEDYEDRFTEEQYLFRSHRYSQSD